LQSIEVDLNSAQMATVLGITDRRVRQLAAEGVVKRAERRGRYRLVPSVANYIATLSANERDAGLAPIRQEQLLRLQRENALRDRELISMDEAAGIVDQLVGWFVSSLNGLPPRVTNDVRERRRLEAIIDTERQRLADMFAEIQAKLASGGDD
jgi:hypothetical protein